MAFEASWIRVVHREFDSKTTHDLDTVSDIAADILGGAVSKERTLQARKGSETWHGTGVVPRTGHESCSSRRPCPTDIVEDKVPFPSRRKWQSFRRKGKGHLVACSHHYLPIVGGLEKGPDVSKASERAGHRRPNGILRSIVVLIGFGCIARSRDQLGKSTIMKIGR